MSEKIISLKKIVIDKEKSIRNTLNVISKSGMGACILLNKNKFFNVVTDGDIRRALLKGFKLEDKIKLIKIKKSIAVEKNYDLVDLQKKIFKYKLIPIVDSKNNLVDYATSKRFKSIPHSEPVFKGNEFKYLTDTLNSGWISSVGKYVNLFEKKFAKFVNAKFCLATSSGTTALQLAIATLNLKKNDEIILPDFTFVAAINSVIHSGLRPILADIDKDCLCITLDSIKKVITKKTKAIIIVHLYGNTPNMDKIISYCKKKKIKIIEDCAEAIGTKYKKKHVGNFGDFGTFSFFGNKTITTGEGGMIVFKNKKNYLKAKKLRDHGMSQKIKYWHDEIGFNFRITNMQAAIGVAQLEKVKFYVKRKVDIQKKFCSNLREIKEIFFPKKNKNIYNSHWLSYFKIKKQKKLRGRQKLINYLSNQGIEARTGFISSHLMKIYKKYSSNKTNYPNSLDASKSIVTLPSSINLSDRDIAYICKKIKIFFQLKL